MSLANFYGITYEDLWKWASPVCILVALLTLWNIQVRRQRKIIKEGADRLERAFAESNRLLAEAAHYVKALLPDPVDKAGIAVDWRFEPSAALGGDCFGYHWLDDDRFAFYLLDVAGHGVSASLLAVAVINVLRSQTLKNTDFRVPENVLSSLNNAFPMDEQDEMYFTIWYGLYNRSSRTLSYASGGHPPAILLTRGNDGSANIVNLKTPNLFVGGLPGIEYEATSVTLSQPCNLYVFSDGAFEIADGKGSMWGLQNFQEFLALSFARREPVLDRLMNYVSAHKQGASLEDDLSIVEIHFD
jgi:sigma-B regulation protein RsbU (phosphoserine phosphatase)